MGYNPTYASSGGMARLEHTNKFILGFVSLHHGPERDLMSAIIKIKVMGSEFRLVPADT